MYSYFDPTNRVCIATIDLIPTFLKVVGVSATVRQGPSSIEHKATNIKLDALNNLDFGSYKYPMISNACKENQRK